MPVGFDYDAADIFSQARAFLNDFSIEAFDNTKLTAYAQAAWEQMNLKLVQAGAPTFLKQALLAVPAGTTSIAFTGGPPILPADLMEPLFLEESPSGKAEWIPMSPLKLGHNVNTAVADRTENLRVWTWKGQIIHLAGATQARDILLHYMAMEPELLVSSTDLGLIVVNSRGFMSRKTAGYASLFVMQDLERAAALNDEAMDFMDTIIGIATNQAQNISVRRRAYGSSRRRGMWYPKTS